MKTEIQVQRLPKLYDLRLGQTSTYLRQEGLEESWNNKSEEELEETTKKDSSSIFVGAEREELIRNDPDRDRVYDWTDLNPASYRWSLRACRLGQSGSPRCRKRTDSCSLVKVENSHAVPVVAS